MANLAAEISKLNPFHRRHTIDDEDKGEAIDAGTVAGGGHAARQSTVTKDLLRVSHALKSFLIQEGVLHASEAGLSDEKPTGALRELLDKSHINVPSHVISLDHPLPEYFVSSSHNTYLMAGQLYGQSNASAYEIALSTGSRCVEIDAWDNDEDKDEPRVTHGYTLVSSIPFRQVCETIRDVVDREAADHMNAAPIMISLENHCAAHGQLRLVQIMTEVFQHRLVSKAIRDKGTEEQKGTGDHITLADLENKVLLIVEYHLPNAGAVVVDDHEHDSGPEENDEERKALEEYKAKKKASNPGDIIPELAELGVYAQSVKPVNNSWFESVLDHAPHHQLINVSETGLHSHLPISDAKIAHHNAHHLMRVFPKGTRIGSANLAPVPFWGIGAQICALNWQTFNASAQLNEALFSGSMGYVLKPAALRAGGSGDLSLGAKKKMLRLHVGGATDVPIPKDRGNEDIKPYLTCTLYHPSDLANTPPKRKTHAYKQHKVTGFLHHHENPPVTDPLWRAVLEWEFYENEMVFLRLLIKSDDAFAWNPVFAVAAVRLCYVVEGWSFIRMLDLKGHETTCSILVRFEVADA